MLSLNFWRAVILLAAGSLSGCFNSPDEKISISDTCSIDSISGASGTPPEFIATSRSDLIFSGWAAEPKIGGTPIQIGIELINANNSVVFYGKGSAGIKRPDVAVVLNAQSTESSGFAIKTNISGVPDGNYLIFVVSKFEGQQSVCNTKRRLIVRG